MKKVCLRMNGITKRYPGIIALNDVSLEACSGEALALMGANGAGKSTLMNILGGVTIPDEGEMYIHEDKVQFSTPSDAGKFGIGFIHQEMALCPSMSVVENIYINRFILKGGLIDHSLIEKNCAEALHRLGCWIDPKKKIRELSSGDRQLVEIARILISDAEIIIFDEPTSSLATKEKERLFKVIQTLKREGKTIIYITHFLDEIYSICDRTVVLRNGEISGQGSLSDLSKDYIIHYMIGSRDNRINACIERPETENSGDVVLSVNDFTRDGAFNSVSFNLLKGEILGLWGLLGSGRTELARAITGLDKINSGTLKININGKLSPVKPGNTKKWIGMITENRRDDGLLLPMSARENISLTSLKKYLLNIWPFLDKKKEMKNARQMVESVGIKISDIEQPVATLSGGNQQKVIFARWLLSKPPILIMDEPTRGVDVGAKAEIYQLITQLACEGISIILISSEIDEIMELSDRFLIINRGRIVDEMPQGTSRNELMRKASVSSEEQKIGK